MTTVSECLDTAVVHHQAGRLAEAEALYRYVLSQVPDQADAMHLLGVIARRTNREAEALTLIKTAIAIAPELPDPYENLGGLLADLGNYAEATRAFCSGVQLRPTVSRPFVRLAMAFNRCNQRDAAISALQTALCLDPKSANAWSDLGVLYKYNSDVDAAYHCYRNAICITPDLNETHMNLSVLYKDNPQDLPTDGDIILYQHHPGLGDNLIYSTLPELFARQGRTVYMSDLMRTRNPGIYDLVWGCNPYIKGMTTQKPNAGTVLMRSYCDNSQVQNLVKRIEINHGFYHNNEFPKIYYIPKHHDTLKGKVLIDMHSVTGKYYRNVLVDYVRFLQDRFGYRRNNMVQINFKGSIADCYARMDNVAIYTVKDIFDYCDAIASASALITVHSGANTLGAAIRGYNETPMLHCLLTVHDYNDKAYVWSNVDYVVTAAIVSENERPAQNS